MEEKSVVQTLRGALRAVLILEGGQGLKGKFMSCFYPDGEQGWQNCSFCFDCFSDALGSK